MAGGLIFPRKKKKKLKVVEDHHPNSMHMGVSENVVYPILPNGFADHYPY